MNCLSLFSWGCRLQTAIKQTAFDAIAYNYPSVVVLADATAANSGETHTGNLVLLS
ncbi:unnamed protein product [Sphagnum jensenii]|uniref:Uncharacterized protein n=1 Tax=Sphagnum jensenii TaxID=128206 RepID=A0ABP1ANK2_9BRYO